MSTCVVIQPEKALKGQNKARLQKTYNNTDTLYFRQRGWSCLRNVPTKVH